MNNMTCAKCTMDAAVAKEKAAVAAERDNTPTPHNEQDNQISEDNDHNEDADAATNEDKTAGDEEDPEKNNNGGDNGDDDVDGDDDDNNDGSDGNNRWSASGRRFKSADEAIVRGDKEKNNPGSYLWVRPKLFSRAARHQLGRLIQHLNLHKFSEIRRLAEKLNLPCQPTAQQIHERNIALGALTAGLRKFRKIYTKKITEHQSATLPETNRALLACYLMADYEEDFCISLYWRMRKIKKLRNEKFRSLFPLIEDVRVYDLMLKKLADCLRDEQKNGTTISIQLVRDYGLNAYNEACQEVEQEDAGKNDDNSNNEELVGNVTDEIEFMELDDKDTNSGYDMGEEFPRGQSEKGKRVPSPASIVRVLEPLFPREVQEQLADLAFAFGLHDRNWLDDLLRWDDTAINRLAEELSNFCNTYKNGWQTKTGRALLSCLQGVQSNDTCAYLEDFLRKENCKLKRTLYRSFFPITTVKSLYDDSLMYLDLALKKCKDEGKIITVPLLRELALQSHQLAQEVYNEKRRQQEKARKQKELRRQEERLKDARIAGKCDAARSKTPPAAPAGKGKARNVTASDKKKAGAAKSTTRKNKAPPKKKTIGTKRPAASTAFNRNDSNDDTAINSRTSRVLPFSRTPPTVPASRKRTEALKQKYPDARWEEIRFAIKSGMEPIEFMDIVRDERVRNSGLTPEEVCNMILDGFHPIHLIEDFPDNPDGDKET